MGLRGLTGFCCGYAGLYWENRCVTENQMEKNINIELETEVVHNW